MRLLGILVLAPIAIYATFGCSVEDEDSAVNEARWETIELDHYECTTNLPLPDGKRRTLNFELTGVRGDAPLAFSGTSALFNAVPVEVSPPDARIEGLNANPTLTRKTNIYHDTLITIEGRLEGAFTTSLTLFDGKGSGFVTVKEERPGQADFTSSVTCQMTATFGQTDAGADAAHRADGSLDASNDGGARDGTARDSGPKDAAAKDASKPIPDAGAAALIYGCGGFAGLQCPPGMKCVYEAFGPDQMGTCE